MNTTKEYQFRTIEISGLIKIYKRKEVETSALRGLSCKIDKGQIVVLMGPSGCGKTTLLNIIGGISRPSAGGMMVEGKKYVVQDGDMMHILFNV